MSSSGVSPLRRRTPPRRRGGASRAPRTSVNPRAHPRMLITKRVAENPPQTSPSDEIPTSSALSCMLSHSFD